MILKKTLAISKKLHCIIIQTAIGLNILFATGDKLHYVTFVRKRNRSEIQD